MWEFEENNKTRVNRVNLKKLEGFKRKLIG